MQTVFTWVNGQRTDQIHVFDRGFSYGDGFFSTLLVRNRQVLNWPAHQKRLLSHAQVLRFMVPSDATLLATIRATFAQLPADWQAGSLALKLIFSRGEGGRGYLPPLEPQPTWVVQWSLAPQTSSEPLHLHLCQTQASIHGQLAGLKHLNRLENVLARQELADKGWQEGLMQNAFGDVISATQANLFALNGQTIFTPKLDQSGIAGCVRQQLANLLPNLGWHWRERKLQTADLPEMEALFLSNSLRGIQVVSHLSLSPEQTIAFETQSVNSIHEAWENWQSQNGLDL